MRGTYMKCAKVWRWRDGRGREMARKARTPRLRRVSNLPGEEWKLVNGTEDYYISNLGRFKRVTHKGDCLRKLHQDSEGYLRANIDHKKLRVHRLVAEAFLPNPNNYPVVDHLDNCKSNNRWDNLEWVTQQENTRRAAEDGLLGTRDTRMVLAINEFDQAYLFDNGAECARFIDSDIRAVTKTLAGKQPTVKGCKVFRLGDFEDRRTKKDVE